MDFREIPGISNTTFNNAASVCGDGGGNTFVGTVEIYGKDDEAVVLRKVDANGNWSKIKEWKHKRGEITKPGTLTMAVRGNALFMVVTLRDNMQQPFFLILPNVAIPFGTGGNITVINQVTQGGATSPSNTKDDEARKQAAQAQDAVKTLTGRVDAIVAEIDKIWSLIRNQAGNTNPLKDLIWSVAKDAQYALLKQLGLVK